MISLLTPLWIYLKSVHGFETSSEVSLVDSDEMSHVKVDGKRTGQLNLNHTHLHLFFEEVCTALFALALTGE